MISADLINSLKDARPYGIYKDVECGPMNDEYSDYPTAAHWDGDVTKDPDTLYEWLCDFFEDSLNDKCVLEKYQSDLNDCKKWSFLKDLEFELSTFPDIDFYSYEMKSTLVGICLTLEEANNVVNSINTELNPRFEVLYSSELRYSPSLKAICDYFRELE